MKATTEKQKNILSFIERFQEENGMPPTIYEIADEFHVKTSTIFAHLRALQKKKLLTRSSKARSITLSLPVQHKKRNASLRTIPYVISRNNSLMKDGSAILCDVSMLGHHGKQSDANDLCALRVSGNQFRSCGILNGDVAIIRKSPVEYSQDDIVLTVQNGICELRKCSDIAVKDLPAKSDTNSSPKPHSGAMRHDMPVKGILVGIQRSI